MRILERTKKSKALREGDYVFAYLGMSWGAFSLKADPQSDYGFIVLLA